MEVDLLPRFAKQQNKNLIPYSPQEGREKVRDKAEGESPRAVPIVHFHRKGFSGRLRVEVGHKDNFSSARSPQTDWGRLRNDDRTKEKHGVLQRQQTRDLVVGQSAINPWIPKPGSTTLDENDMKQRNDEAKSSSANDSRRGDRKVRRMSSAFMEYANNAAIAASHFNYAADGISFKEVEATQEIFDTLAIVGKDRIYAELNVLVSFLDTIMAEPFASMGEFEILKAANVCSLETFSHKETILELEQTLEKMYLCLQGVVSVFDFSESIIKFEQQKQNAFKLFQRQASSTGLNGIELQKATKELQEDWSIRYNVLFKSNFSLLERHENVDLPEGTRFWNLCPGAVFGAGAPLQDASSFPRSLIMISNPGSGQTLKLLALSRQQMELINSIPSFRYNEKAQILRSSKLFTGISKLSIKMLAMQVQEQTIGPNLVVVAQDAAPTHLYVVKRGYLRVVRTLGKRMAEDMIGFSVNRRSSTRSRGSLSHRLSGEISSRKIPANMEGKAVEIGLMGPTHFFGAVSVLEHGHINLSPAHLITCSVIDVYTLARPDVGKVSYEDRETMTANARRLEISIRDEWQIVEQLKDEKHWTVFKASLLRTVVTNNTNKKKQALGCFETGVSSSSSITKYEKKDLPKILAQAHPFQMLGSVVIGYY